MLGRRSQPTLLGLSPLSNTGMVTIGMADGADAAHVDGKGVDIRCGDR